MSSPGGEGKRLAIVGAGSWGTALSIVAARNNHLVMLLAREESVAQGFRRTRKNPFFFPEFEIPGNVTPTTRLAEALDEADYCFTVVPSHAMREVALEIREYLGRDTVVITASKGIENGSLMRMSEV